MLDPSWTMICFYGPKEPEVAVLVGVGQIAGIQPFVGHDLAGYRRGVPVTRHAAA
jgi:hypothetical protein